MTGPKTKPRKLTVIWPIVSNIAYLPFFQNTTPKNNGLKFSSQIYKINNKENAIKSIYEYTK